MMAVPPSVNINAQAYQAPKHKYRPELDGLRAFAVLAVIINHFNQDLLPSGYLGVDIFFVISGYVITSSLTDRPSKNFLDFLTGFYERRIKRLVPALLVFVLVTSVLICLVNPDPIQALRTGLFSLFGLSNLYLFQQSTDYFSQSTKLNPFTHTWSLGVEEQFYLLFPFLIWFTGFGQQTAHGKRNLLLWIGALTIASLIGFIYLYEDNQPASYFLMPPRFWEMAAGCLLFVGVQRRARIGKPLEKVPPLLALAAITVVMLRPLGGREGIIAIVALTAMLINSLKKGSRAYKLLTIKMVIYIGLISYSLYLWHWGILSLARWTIGISWWSTPILLGIVAVSATLSYEYLEQPIRRKAIKNRSRTFVIGASALVAAAVIETALASPSVTNKLTLVREDDGLFQKGRKSHENYVGPFTKRTAKDCTVGPARLLSRQAIVSSINKCLWVGKNTDKKTPVVAILGDSHARQLFPIAETLAKEKNLSVYDFSYGTCLVPQDPRQIKEKCRNVNDVPMWVYEALQRPVIFIIASVADPILHFPFAAMQKQRVAAFQMAFEEVLNKGNYLIVVAPNPKFPSIDSSISDICGRGPWAKVNPDCNKEYKFVAKAQRGRRTIYLEELTKWASKDERVAIVDPFDILCGEKNGYCYASSDGKAKYWDATHLNFSAVQSTYPLYKSAIEQLLRVHSGFLTAQ
ncbi:MAG: acyltransferase family protein [Cyanobacteriota bacterium]|jgi:peptidoglycan/LPS O-acetylase OafA/YrhL